MGEYVGAYGDKASVIVAVEKYTQTVTVEGAPPLRPRQMVAEFAIVKADGHWTGFRDVIEVNGQQVVDRRDRLLRLLTDSSSDGHEITRFANESARYNIGPIARNLNVPTMALFLFEPANLRRFTFTRKGTRKIDNVETLEIHFQETARPTLVMRTGGSDVPSEGTFWVVPGEGTVVRTRLRLRGFADLFSIEQQMPDPSQTGSMYSRLFESVADIEVIYRRDDRLGLWFPSTMSEFYEGPITMGTKQPVTGRATTRATYADFKRFETATQIKIPK